MNEAKSKNRENKSLLFISIALLSLGILLKLISDWNQLALLLITMGAVGKLFYLRKRIVKRIYKPGIELLFLSLGLTLFLIGLYLKTIEGNQIHQWFTIPGILLKTTFILLFIRKSKKN